MWSLPTLNFSNKKKQLEKLVKGFPEKRHGMQTFATNRQSDRSGFAEAFANICGEELNMLSTRLKKDIQIEDIWSVSYKKGEYHTPHDHGSVGLSGILYLNMDKKHLLHNIFNRGMIGILIEQFTTHYQLLRVQWLLFLNLLDTLQNQVSQ
jgi:hypothetical protein